MSRGEERHDRSVEMLRATAYAWIDLWWSGRSQPALAIAELQNASHSAVRSRIHRARLAGLLGRVNHNPRHVDWGELSWVACHRCRRQWPCAPAGAWYRKHREAR